MAITALAEYAHLSDADVEALGAELDTVRADIEALRGASDRAYIRRIIFGQRCLEVAARLVIAGSRGKVGWAAGTGESAKTSRSLCEDPLVELAGIEPASSSVEPGLLRVQSVMSLFSAPALAQTRRRQAQSGLSPAHPS